MTEAVFLGTGNFLAPEGRYWNSFVLDDTILVEPCPTSLAPLTSLRAAGARSRCDRDLPFPSRSHLRLALLIARAGAVGAPTWAPGPQYVVGPPGVEQFLREMNELGSIPNVLEAAEQFLDLRYVEVDGTWQQAGPLRFRAVEVDHVPYLRCFGYLFERDGRTVGYSGDTQPCAGLSELGRGCRFVGARVQRAARAGRAGQPHERSLGAGAAG